MVDLFISEGTWVDWHFILCGWIWVEWLMYFIPCIFCHHLKNPRHLNCVYTLCMQCQSHWLVNSFAVCYKGETIYLHNAVEAWRWLEQHSVESRWSDEKGVWHKLRRDAAGTSSCKLPTSQNLLLWPPLLWGGAAAWVQALPSYPSEISFIHALCCKTFLHCLPIYYILLCELHRNHKDPEGVETLWSRGGIQHIIMRIPLRTT